VQVSRLCDLPASNALMEGQLAGSTGQNNIHGTP
jgi:hypothetical protein